MSSRHPFVIASVASLDGKVSNAGIAAPAAGSGMFAGHDSLRLKAKAITMALLKTACAIISSFYVRVIIFHFDFTQQLVTQ